MCGDGEGGPDRGESNERGDAGAGAQANLSGELNFRFGFGCSTASLRLCNCQPSWCEVSVGREIGISSFADASSFVSGQASKEIVGLSESGIMSVITAGGSLLLERLLGRTTLAPIQDPRQLRDRFMPFSTERGDNGVDVQKSSLPSSTANISLPYIAVMV